MTKNKFNLISKFILTVMLFLFTISDTKSQPLFAENFNFPVRDSLENIGRWIRSGSDFASNVKVTSQGLTYAGYLASGIGNTSHLSNLSTGDFVLNNFPEQNSGTVYLSFMIRVDSLTATATENYNICFDEAFSGTGISTKVYIKKINSSTFNIGINKTSGPVKYSPVVYSKNTTYLVICSYTFAAGVDNDITRLYISTSGVPATEPVSPAAADSIGYDANNIGEIGLINQYLLSGLQGSSVKIDGIRIGTSWNSTLFQPYNIQLNLKALIQGFYNNTTNKMVKDTVTVFLRYQTAPYSIADSSKAVLDSNGNATVIFTRISNEVKYYIVVKHRNTMETWSNVSDIFENNSQNFDFTTFASRAYGSNQILKGTKYCLYNGDVNQEGNIDLTDIVTVNNAASIFSAGYKPTDVDGNNITDLTDVISTYNNSTNFINIKRP